MSLEESIIAIPPGMTIKEQLEVFGFTQKELAIRLDCSEKHLSKLINGEVNLSFDMALKLSNVFGMDSMFWLKLEYRYREALIKTSNNKEINDDINVINEIPYSVFIQNKWILDYSNDIIKQVFSLRNLYKISKLTLLNNKFLSPMIIDTCINNTQSIKNFNIAWARHIIDNYDLDELYNSKNICVSKIRKLIVELNAIKNDATKYKTIKELALNYGVYIEVDEKSKAYINHGLAFIINKKLVISIIRDGLTYKEIENIMYDLLMNSLKYIENQNK